MMMMYRNEPGSFFTSASWGMAVLYLLLAFLLFLLLPSTTCGEPSLLVANTRGGSEVFQYGLESGMISEWVLPNILESPDHIVSYQGHFYISTGTDVNTSAIARLTPTDGMMSSTSTAMTMELDFATGGGLKRPYGFDFYEDTLYVASFMTDQILMYNATTGEYMGVFAQGNATEEGLCNGPNQIAIHDGMLYMTTQGSFIDVDGNLQYAFASQTVVYDLTTGEGSVFIPQPEPDPEGMGFISMLGILIGCGEESSVLGEEDCTVYTTDFAGGLRLYAFSDQSLIDMQSTSFAPGSATGSLALGPDGTIFSTGFASEDSGIIMSFEPDMDPTNNSTLAVVYSSMEGMLDLARQIGIFYMPDETMDPGPSSMAPSGSPMTDSAPNYSNMSRAAASSLIAGLVLLALFW